MSEKTVILVRKEVELRTSLSRASIYRLMSAGKFPRQINLGVYRVGWKESEIDQWLEQRVAESQSAA